MFLPPFFFLLSPVASMNFFLPCCYGYTAFHEIIEAFPYDWSQFLAVRVLAVVLSNISLLISVMSMFLRVFVCLFLFQEYCYLCNKSSQSSQKSNSPLQYTGLAFWYLLSFILAIGQNWHVVFPNHFSPFLLKYYCTVFWILRFLHTGNFRALYLLPHVFNEGNAILTCHLT